MRLKLPKHSILPYCREFGRAKGWPAWESVIIDEAHRLKSLTSITRGVIQSMSIKWLLLLTGALLLATHVLVIIVRRKEYFNCSSK